MDGKILRTGLFGFKRKDVLNYILKLDESSEKRLTQKDEENKALKEELYEMKAELAEARKNRDAIVSVLEVAQKNAKDIIENAKRSAEEIEQKAKTIAETEKNNLNREIEIKKREMNNQFLTESKKIGLLKKEIEELRQISIKSIKKFEHDLSNIERVLEQKETFAENAVETQEKVSEEQFFDSIRKVPIRIVKSENAIEDAN